MMYGMHSGHSDNGSVKKIPYGISDYGLIRPRRFGKSLFLTLMEAYFDIFYRERFEELFKGTWIYDHPTDYLLTIMTQWYGNYLFSEDDNVRLFNSDMVLYFIDNYLTRKKLPGDLIDRNVRIDYEKSRHLIIVDIDQKRRTRKPTPNGNFSKLKKIIEE
jgi:hypothetical protein